MTVIEYIYLAFFFAFIFGVYIILFNAWGIMDHPKLMMGIMSFGVGIIFILPLLKLFFGTSPLFFNILLITGIVVPISSIIKLLILIFTNKR